MTPDERIPLQAEIAEMLARLKLEFVDALPGIGADSKSRLIRLFDVWRQVTLRRIVDLAEAANDFYALKRLVPGCTLTRSVVETVALHYMVVTKLDVHIEKTDWRSAHALLKSATFGRRDRQDWPEKSVQILTAIDALDKQFPGFRSEYERLCEYAHPGLAGAYGMYARRVDNDMRYVFGDNPNSFEMGVWGQIELSRALSVVVTFDQFLKAMRPKFVVLVEVGSE